MCGCPAGGSGPVASAASAAHDRFGIRLLEAPASRRDDPRARSYIVDHLLPGTVIHRRFEVSNTSGSALRPELYAAAADVQNGTFGLAPGRTRNELSDWISVDRAVVDLPPHSARRLTATIAVPRQAAAGERYAVIWAQVASPKTAAHQVSVVHRIGIRVYLDIGPGGEPPSDFRIETLTPERTREGRPQVVAQVRNTGRRALDLNGTLTLSEGPGSLRAGPFRATPGTTLGPGQAGPVLIELGRLSPARPAGY